MPDVVKVPLVFFWWIIGERCLTFYGKNKNLEKKVQGGEGFLMFILLLI